MTSNSHIRLTSASEAWARLFRNTRPPITQTQQSRRATTQITGDTTNTLGTIRPNAHTPQHQEGHITPQEHPVRTVTITQPTTQSLKDNVTWGDKISDKHPELTRIYSQNVNGIRFEKDGGQFNELCQIHREVQADVLCIQEHNIDTTQFIVKQTLHQVCRKSWQRA